MHHADPGVPLFTWLREEADPISEALGRLVTTLEVIGAEKGA